MALVSMRQLLDHAAENGYGVPAFNVNNLEQMRDIVIARYEAFGTAGNASKIKPISVDGMSEKYLSGVLDQKAA